MTGQPAPMSLIELIRCGCKTVCATNSCSCRKASLSCTASCYCTINGGECYNPHTNYNDDEDMDDSDDSSDEE